MSFNDKVWCGIALMAIQSFAPTELDPCITNCDFFRSAIAYTCGGASVFGLVIIAVMWPMTIGERYNNLIS